MNLQKKSGRLQDMQLGPVLPIESDIKHHQTNNHTYVALHTFLVAVNNCDRFFSSSPILY
jgi:hypothetical protein